jgi:competence protein ComEA
MSEKGGGVSGSPGGGRIMIRKIFLSFILTLFMVVSALAAINLNNADQATLESIKGIGPAKAAAIVEYRDAHGKFKSVDDLLQIKGIGPKLLEQIRQEVEVTE